MHRTFVLDELLLFLPSTLTCQLLEKFGLHFCQLFYFWEGFVAQSARPDLQIFEKKTPHYYFCRLRPKSVPAPRPFRSIKQVQHSKSSDENSAVITCAKLKADKETDNQRKVSSTVTEKAHSKLPCPILIFRFVCPRFPSSAPLLATLFGCFSCTSWYFISTCWNKKNETDLTFGEVQPDLALQWPVT